MKALLLVCFVLSYASICKAQTQTVVREQSNIEKFSAKSGALIEKQFIDIGKLRGLQIQALVLTDLMNNLKTSGVRFEYATGSRYSSDRIAFLDLDEVDALIKSINFLKTNVFPTTKDSYDEIVFHTRGGFQAGCYFSDGRWTTFIQVDKFDKESLIAMQPSDFDQLLGFLVEAKRKLG